MNDAKLLLEALRLAEEGAELTDEHKDQLGAMRRDATRRLQPEGGETFRHSFGGYLIGPVFFDASAHRKREIDGFQCIQWLLQQIEVPAITLWSCDTLGSHGLLFWDAEPGTNDGEDWTNEPSENPYQPSQRQFHYKIEFAQSLLRRLDELNELPESPDRNRRIMFIEGQLRTYRYKREIKTFNDEVEKARKNVQKAIKAAIALLIRAPETTHIGLHLQDTIKTGFVCEYTGTWDWNF